MASRVCLIRQEATAGGESYQQCVRALEGWEWSQALWSDWAAAGPHNDCWPLLVAATAEPCEKAIEFLHWFRNLTTRSNRVAVLHKDCPELVLELAAQVSDEFLLSPLRDGELRQRFARFTKRDEDLDAIARQLIQHSAVPILIGGSEAFLRVLKSLPRIALSGLPVLITGETGTGKDLCARVLHQLGKRRGNAFITADCSAIPSHLFENELFGHAKGAYTDASQDHRGLAGWADGGTLFLDEIDALPNEAQAKLLRFLEEGTYRPLGSDRALSANVTVIAATNADLQAAVREQRFRSDLYFRLNVLSIHLPPLRARRGDVALLAEKFLRNHPAGEAVAEKRFSQSALEALEAHAWPGNVRELRNVTHRAAVLAQSSMITPQDLEIVPTAEQAPQSATFQERRQRLIELYERTVLEDALRGSDGNVTHAARALGKDRRVFGRMMKRYGIDRRCFA